MIVTREDSRGVCEPLYLVGGASDCAEAGGPYFPPRGFPPAARTLEGKPAGGHLDPRFMAGDTAQQLFENMAARLTNVFGPDSGPAEDDPDFHMPAHICTGSIDSRHWIEQSIDQKDCTLLHRLAYRARICRTIGRARPDRRCAPCIRQRVCRCRLTGKRSGAWGVCIAAIAISDAWATSFRTGRARRESFGWIRCPTRLTGTSSTCRLKTAAFSSASSLTSTPRAVPSWTVPVSNAVIIAGRHRRRGHFYEKGPSASRRPPPSDAC